ncbi:hypothetical protein GGP98_000640 [Salinibacter ruber]|nr:hypothetical protein [Salinibacter ruber]
MIPLNKRIMFCHFKFLTSNSFVFIYALQWLLMWVMGDH